MVYFYSWVYQLTVMRCIIAPYCAQIMLPIHLY